MMTYNLTIDLFRVSGDSKYLDLIFSCPNQIYYMSSLKLTVIDFATNKKRELKFDLSDALGFATDNLLSSWTVRIPVEKLGITFPAMYSIVLKAEPTGVDPDANEIIDEAVCSDVNYVYRCLLQTVTESCDNCANNNMISDEVIRNYLILYGHQAAMFSRDLYTAENYFKILSKCFKNCGCSDNYLTSPCGPKYVEPNCGCGK